MESQIYITLSMLILIVVFKTVLTKRTCDEQFENLVQEFDAGNSRISSDEKLALSHGQTADAKCRFLIQNGLTTDCLRIKGACKNFPLSSKNTLDEEKECNLTEPDCDVETMTIRTFSGSCNNQEHPLWGRADRIYNRLLPSAYDDGKRTPRTKSVCPAGQLPSAREVSNIVHAAETSPVFDDALSVFITIFGQFLAHDFALTPVVTDDDGTPLDCCDQDKHRRDCFSIKVSTLDPDYNKRKCMNFARSEGRLDCEGIRQQKNSQTAYLDLSQVYGVSEEENQSLRTGTGGELIVEVNQKLPIDENNELCDRSTNCTSSDCYCPKSGDVRVNENPALAGMHTMFHRNHNLLAKGLAEQNTNWGDQKLFQTARKINIGIWQHIIYSEYLVAVIGTSIMEEYNISTMDTGYKETYDPTTDATLMNEFATAAFRFGHSMVPDHLNIVDYDHTSKSTENLEDNFFNSNLYHSSNGEGLEHVLLGLMSSRCPHVDRIISNSVRVKLFPEENTNSFDLAALNIQRGRDHGIPSYNTFRELCGFPVAENFSAGIGLTDHSEEAAQRLEKAYKCTDDIDAWTGIVSEEKTEGSRLGRTGQCLLAKQFQLLQNGDRFFYEFSGYGGFTEAQLDEIKKVNMSTVICLNTNATTVQENVFFMSDPATNMMTVCAHSQNVDFNKWISDEK